MEKTIGYSRARKLEATLFNVSVISLLLIFYVFFPQTFFPDALDIRLMYLLGAVYILPILWEYVSFLNYKLEITPDRFVIHKLFSKREWEFKQIKGYQIGLDISLVKKYDETDILKIDEDIASQEGLEDLIVKQFDLLETDEKINEQLTNILSNSDFGNTIQERKQNFKRTSRVARRLSLSAFLLFNLSFFVLQYSLLAYVLLGTSFLTLWLVYRKKGMASLRLNSESNIYPSYGFVIFVFVGVFAIRSMFMYHLLNYKAIWPYAIPVILIFGMLSYATIKKNLKLSKASLLSEQMFTVLIYSLVMGYYTMVTINCEFDKTPLIENRALVIDTEEGEYSYDAIIRLKNNQETRVIIGRDLFESTRKGDSLRVYTQQGILGVPWIRYIDKLATKKTATSNK